MNDERYARGQFLMGAIVFGSPILRGGQVMTYLQLLYREIIEFLLYSPICPAKYQESLKIFQEKKLDLTTFSLF